MLEKKKRSNNFSFSRKREKSPFESLETLISNDDEESSIVFDFLKKCPLAAPVEQEFSLRIDSIYARFKLSLAPPTRARHTFLREVCRDLNTFSTIAIPRKGI